MIFCPRAGVGVVEEGKGGGGVPQTMDDDTGLLYASQEQPVRDDPTNGAGRERLPGWRHDVPAAIDTSRGRKERIRSTP